MKIIDSYISDLENEIDRLSEQLDSSRLDYTSVYDSICEIRSELEHVLYVKQLVEGDKNMKYTAEFNNQVALAIELVISLQSNNADYKDIALKIIDSDKRFSGEYKPIISNAIMQDRLF